MCATTHSIILKTSSFQALCCNRLNRTEADAHSFSGIHLRLLIFPLIITFTQLSLYDSLKVKKPHRPFHSLRYNSRFDGRTSPFFINLFMASCCTVGCLWHIQHYVWNAFQGVSAELYCIFLLYRAFEKSLYIELLLDFWLLPSMGSPQRTINPHNNLAKVLLARCPPWCNPFMLGSTVWSGSTNQRWVSNPDPQMPKATTQSLSYPMGMSYHSPKFSIHRAFQIMHNVFQTFVFVLEFSPPQFAFEDASLHKLT